MLVESIAASEVAIAQKNADKSEAEAYARFATFNNPNNAGRRASPECRDGCAGSRPAYWKYNSRKIGFGFN